MSSSSSSSPSSSVSSSIIGEENNENPTGMLLGFQQLKERIIAATTVNDAQLPVPSIIDIIGCDITIDGIQTAKQELINQGFNLKKDVNKSQLLHRDEDHDDWTVTPLIHFCWTGDLFIIKFLFLIGADCTQLCTDNYWFPMLAAAEQWNLDICKWLFEYGGDAKYQINKETTNGVTPLHGSYEKWIYGYDNEDEITCCWLLRNGGGQNLSSEAMSRFNDGNTENHLIIWMRENIRLHDTFILFLCGATTMITSSLSSEHNDGGNRKHTHKRKRRIHSERSLQILNGHPGIMKLVGDHVGLIIGKEIRMIKEFNELFIEYNINESYNDDDDNDDDNDDDDDDDDDEDDDC